MVTEKNSTLWSPTLIRLLCLKFALPPCYLSFHEAVLSVVNLLWGIMTESRDGPSVVE